MYPEPPLLIRRALEDHTLPAGTAGFETKVIRGADIFISLYNLHRAPELWPNPDKFDPERFLYRVPVPLAAVEAGAGATVVSRNVVAARLRAGILAALPLTLPDRPFWLLRHKQRYRSKAGEVFLASLTASRH